MVREKEKGKEGDTQNLTNMCTYVYICLYVYICIPGDSGFVTLYTEEQVLHGPGCHLFLSKLEEEAGHEGERQGNGRQPVRESRSAVVRNLRERAQAYTMRLRGRARERAKGREWVSEE